MKLGELTDRFDQVNAVLVPLGHGVIIRRTRLLMEAGHFDEARRFVQEAARRLTLGSLSDLAREIGLWTYARGTPEDLDGCPTWVEARDRDLRFLGVIHELHQTPRLQSLLSLNISELGLGTMLTAAPSPPAESIDDPGRTQVWIRPSIAPAAADPVPSLADDTLSMAQERAAHAASPPEAPSRTPTPRPRHFVSKITVFTTVLGLMMLVLVWLLLWTNGRG